ncbi:MAG TPA: protocatechuate 3,4-dioxygenase subunit alpha [Pseudonocardiaceae bacterium]|jgi:protocatechuate 3,4-dioxygenase alpha subunit|nr:protocatechuate 3,4-dioxygenase subunit alpha [Pseudonocardiaceae bacterium]
MTDLTPSQTVGPFLHIVLPWPDGPFASARDAPGAVLIDGHVYDGAGEPVPDALIETWQVGPDGHRGFGRCPTTSDGWYGIYTVPPPAQPDRNGDLEAPHLDVSVFARGLLRRLVTRIYFPDLAANTADPVLRTIDPARRGTLVAVRTHTGYRFDIHLQGDAETVFFDV